MIDSASFYEWFQELPEHFNDLPVGLLEILYIYWQKCIVEHKVLCWHYDWHEIGQSNLQSVNPNDPMLGRIDELLPKYDKGKITKTEILEFDAYLKTLPTGPVE